MFYRGHQIWKIKILLFVGGVLGIPVEILPIWQDGEDD